MSGINKVIIVGNLGDKPTINYNKKGEPVANLSVATSEEWKDRQTGEQQSKVEWHRISVFGNSANFALNFLDKGSKVYIEGKLQTSKWQDKNGQDRYTTETIVAGYTGQLIGLDKKQTNSQGQNFPYDMAGKKSIEKDEDDIGF